MVAPVSGGLRVVRVNEPARRCGVRPGQTSAEAAALAAGLVVHAEDVGADRRALERVAAWADCLSPVVALAGEDGLMIDVTGCARVFGGEDRLGRRAVGGLAALGFTAWAALADTPGAAWALAYAGDRFEDDRVAHPSRVGVALTGTASPQGDDRDDDRYAHRLTVCPPGQSVAALARLPVWALRVEPAAVEGLRRVGVETIEALLHLPRSAVAKRFGDGVLRRLDQALGDAPELLVPFHSPPVVCARVGFIDATDRWEHVQSAVSRAVDQVCATLDRRVAGVRRLHVTFHLARDPLVQEVDAPVRTECVTDLTEIVELARATRDPKKLVHLVGVRLEGLSLPARVEGVSVWSRSLEGLDGAQQTWFDTQAEDAAALGDLLDRMALRLGRWRVVQPRLVEDHVPERAYAYAPAEVTPGAVAKQAGPKDPLLGLTYEPDPSAHPSAHLPQARALSCRPLRLLREPVPIEVLALLPDGPVLRFRHAGCDHAVIRWAGPERVETGWWVSRGIRRDYYRVEDDSARRYWIFKDLAAGGWFVHGIFE
ncbi:MAG TPA: DNA polymerase Y family protein [Phycisphaerae bacterium]|nr:DNA polymerase Y family protein [Phycisphaerae bacterium]